jgi:hypothetical protein
MNGAKRKTTKAERRVERKAKALEVRVRELLVDGQLRTTRELERLTRRPGPKGARLVLERLEAEGIVAHEPGPKRAKLWRLVDSTDVVAAAAPAISRRNGHTGAPELHRVQLSSLPEVAYLAGPDSGTTDSFVQARCEEAREAGLAVSKVKSLLGWCYTLGRQESWSLYRVQPLPKPADHSVQAGQQPRSRLVYCCDPPGQLAVRVWQAENSLDYVEPELPPALDGFAASANTEAHVSSREAAMWRPLDLGYWPPELREQSPVTITGPQGPGIALPGWKHPWPFYVLAWPSGDPRKCERCGGGVDGVRSIGTYLAVKSGRVCVYCFDAFERVRARIGREVRRVTRERKEERVEAMRAKRQAEVLAQRAQEAEDLRLAQLEKARPQVAGSRFPSKSHGVTT